MEDESARKPSALPDLSGCRVLLALDNPVNQMATTSHLEKIGCCVTIVDNGVAAVEAAARNPFDVILMDLSMPGLDGCDAAAQIRGARGPGRLTPIIALTAYCDNEDRRRVLAAGMNDLVTKSLKSAELTAIIAEQIHGPTKTGNTTASQPLLPVSALGSVMEGMDTTTRNRILQEFHRDLTRQLKRLEQAEAEGDAELFERATHALAGFAGTFGISLLHDSAAAANETLRRGMMVPQADTTSIKQLIRRILEELDQPDRAPSG